MDEAKKMTEKLVSIRFFEVPESDIMGHFKGGHPLHVKFASRPFGRGDEKEGRIFLDTVKEERPGFFLFTGMMTDTVARPMPPKVEGVIMVKKAGELFDCRGMLKIND